MNKLKVHSVTCISIIIKLSTNENVNRRLKLRLRADILSRSQICKDIKFIKNVREGN